MAISSTFEAAPEAEEPAVSAAPAAPASAAPAGLRRDRRDGRIAYAQAAAHVSFMSWNAGGGAKNLAGVIDEVGNHIVAVQEAHIGQLQVLDRCNFV